METVGRSGRVVTVLALSSKMLSGHLIHDAKRRFISFSWLIAVQALGCATVAPIGKDVARPAIATDAGEVRVVRYDVFGGSEAEIRLSMNHQRTDALPITGHDAFTRWQVSHRYSLTNSGSSCRPSDLATALSIEMFLPRWVSPRDPADALVDKWSVYLERLREHENGHVEIARRAESAVNAALSKAQPASSCSDLRGQLDSMAAHVVDEFKAREREYDLATDYGAAHGARFP